MSELSDIRDNVRRNLGETTERFYSNAELNQYIGEAYRKYSVLMIEEGDGYFETTDYLDITADIETVSLTALDPVFFKIRLLSKVLSDGSTTPLERNELRGVSNWKNYTSGDGYLPFYRQRGTNIVLMPTPNTSETGSSTAGLKLDYYYIPDIPGASSSDNFEFDDVFPTIYEPLIELDATISALEAKDGMGGVSDIQSFRGRRDEWARTFIDSLSRDENPQEIFPTGINYNNLW